MPPDRGRASKACATCRKQKTRCYAGAASTNSCLRCQTLGLHCSFTDYAESQRRESERSGEYEYETSATNSRLQRLESTVTRLLERLDQTLPEAPPRPGRERLREATETDGSPSIGPSRASSQTGLDRPPAPPMQVIQDLAAEVTTETSAISQTNMTSVVLSDIIQQGIISHQDASILLSIFQEHYGRWVGFDPEASPETLLFEVRKSSPLLCACCLIAVRHTTQDLAERLAPKLYNIAKTELSMLLLSAPQPLEFFQAALILCMWSTTVGQEPLSIDSWLLSGFALQHALTSDVFDTVLGKHSTSTTSSRAKLLVKWSVWNHLCLVHLHYCVGTRRRSMIGQQRIDRCGKILEFDGVTNFQTRMVAEINLYWTMYEHSNDANIDLPKFQGALDGWKKTWGFLMDQPRAQFLQMGHSFARLLAYERALKTKSARVKATLLNEMATLSSSIIRLAMDKTDDRTRHLSDHIYHMITFAAVTLCRLLNLYEEQLVRSMGDVGEMDALVLELVSWLHGIGLKCHIGYTLGTVIRAFHRKLRPGADQYRQELLQAQYQSQSQTSPSSWTSPWGTGTATDLAPFFPELIGTQTEQGGYDWNFLPDWEPFYQGPPT